MGALEASLKSSGALTVTAQNVTFPTTQLTGGSATIQGTTTDWVVDDLSDLGAGWHLTVAATDIVNGTHLIPVGNLAMRLLNTDISVLSGNTPPAVVPLFANFTSLGSAQTFASAGVGEGMGSYSLSPTFQLFLPADAYAGTYSATVTVTIVDGP